MLFRPYHVPLIRSGEKTVTRRDWHPDFNRPLAGNVYPVQTEWCQPLGEVDCFIRVTDDPYKQPLGEMTDEDAQKEGDYETVAEFKETWIEINGEWEPALEVDVVPLEYAGRRDPRVEVGQRA